MGYNLVAAHRSDRAGEGIGIIHRDTLKVRKVDAGLNPTFEYFILELAGRSIISIIYCPPNSSISTFLEEFTDWVSPNKQVCRMVKPNSAAFLELLETDGLMQWVQDPTHQSGTLLDHVITREASSAVQDKPWGLRSSIRPQTNTLWHP